MDDQVSLWLDRLKQGDEQAARDIWERFFPRVRGLAERRMGALSRREYDADDLALSAINALCMGAREGRFRNLEDRDDLWQVLAMITARKAADRWRRQSRRSEVGESILGAPTDEGPRGMPQIPDREPFVDDLEGTCHELLGHLDERLREVAMLRLQGYSNEEIAERQGRSVKSVERYLKTIRDMWSRTDSESD